MERGNLPASIHDIKDVISIACHVVIIGFLGFIVPGGNWVEFAMDPQQTLRNHREDEPHRPPFNTPQ